MTYTFRNLKDVVPANQLEGGMVEQVVQSDSKSGFDGFRVTVPMVTIKAIMNAVDSGEVPALAAFIEAEVAAKQREVLKRMSLNGRSAATDADISLAAINEYIESNRTISISNELWKELFQPVGLVIATRVQVAKGLDQLTQEELLRLAAPTISYWRDRWVMCKRTGGVVSEEERDKLLELFEDAVEASNGTISAGVRLAATRLIRGIRAGADAVSVDVVEI